MTTFTSVLGGSILIVSLITGIWLLFQDLMAKRNKRWKYKK